MFAALGALVALRLIPRLRHILVDLVMELLSHVYEHHQEGFTYVFAAVGWAVRLTLVGSMAYSVYLVIVLFI